MKKKIFLRIKNVSWRSWVLVALVIVGIFLRVYHFKELLVFASDQARDLGIIKSVVNDHAPWPLLGADMTGGQGFRLGPIYYYFQIISAKLFGVGAAQQAYPDVFFGILSIPLLYYFLKRYFSENASLLTTGLYVFSYFVIEYSRFAWNVNLIPFFVLLFLLSLHEFLVAKEKTSWSWIILIGISLGVGVQLHAIILLLFPAVTFLCFALLLKSNLKLWRQLLVVIVVALVLNLGQFISEQRTGFANSKTFLNAFVFKSERTGGSTLKGVELDVACNAQANMHILSSLGNKNICDFLYGNEKSTTYRTKIVLNRNPWSLLGKFASLLFSVLGVWFLLYHFRREQGKRKYFLGLLILYGALYFLIMIPIAPGSRMRYYLPITIMPFVFLGFIYDYLAKKYPRKYLWAVGVIFLLLFVANINSMRQKIEGPKCDASIQKNFGCNLPMN